jgi:anti-sigma regulatory factor (Ser/Thr protein kinase)
MFNPPLNDDFKTPKTIDESQIGGMGILLKKEIADELHYPYPLVKII